MAKVFGINGLVTGKQANQVFAVRNGVQIVRAYNPMVANPNTPKQIEARAKLKLMSQLAAVLAPFIAIPRDGIVSTRNLFTSLNYRTVTYADSTAEVDLVGVKLTKSVVAIPTLGRTRTSGTLQVNLSAPGVGLSRVIYVVLGRVGTELRAIAQRVVSDPGENNNFFASIEVGTGEIYIYAYGVRDNTEAARVLFGEMQVVTAEHIAEVIVTRQLLESDITLTDTTAAYLAAE